MTDKEKTKELVEKAYQNMWDATKNFRLENFDADEYLLNIVYGKSDENISKPYNILDVFQNVCLEMAAWKDQQMIEMFLSFLRDRGQNFVVNTPLYPYFDYKKAIEDLKQAMKGE